MTRSELIEAMAEAMWRGEAIHLAALNRARQQQVWSEQSDATAGPWRSAATNALSAIEQEGMVVVPVAAIKWLNGEVPDDQGYYFGDSPESRSSVRPYWWRTVFTRMIETGRIK